MAGNLKVVGLNVGHDGGCAILIGDRVRFAVSEERLNRHKHSPGWLASLLYCLQATETSLDEIDLFVFSCGGTPLPDAYDGGLTSLGARADQIISVDHHLSHAIGSFCVSPFDEALVVVYDALGNNTDTESYYVGGNNQIEKVGGNNPSRPRVKGIGATYEAFTNFLGFIDQESGKTMALAAYGDPSLFQVPLFDVRGDQVASQLERTHQRGVLEFSRKFGLPFGDCFPAHTSEISWHIAAYVQHQTEIVIVELLRDLMKSTGMTNICLSGGVALNCVINTKIREVLKPNGLFILPPASDTGQALGNALYGFYYLTGELPEYPLRNCFFGRTYTDEEIIAALKREPRITPYGRMPKYRSYSYDKELDVARTAGQLIAEGYTVGWFQGGSELGPRALGHRSILADPRSVIMRDAVNSRIKHREWFRPFASSVLAEKVTSYFHLQNLSSFMLEAPLVKHERRLDIQAAMHIDRTSRLQTVEESQDSLFHRLITEFERVTGVPVVINTSFNDREPIVETPGNALFTFLTTDLDYLILENYLVSKGSY